MEIDEQRAHPQPSSPLSTPVSPMSEPEAREWNDPHMQKKRVNRLAAEKPRKMWCKCGARCSRTRHERPISAPRTATTWTFSGADDGIRTRDPHLGKQLPHECGGQGGPPSVGTASRTRFASHWATAATEAARASASMSRTPAWTARHLWPHGPDVGPTAVPLAKTTDRGPPRRPSEPRARRSRVAGSYPRGRRALAWSPRARRLDRKGRPKGADGWRGYAQA